MSETPVPSAILDENLEEFRAAGHRLIDWICDYFRSPERYPVLSRVTPGEVASSFAEAPSRDGKPYDALIAEFEEKILPGITHWNHPGFLAYFAITGSPAGVLGELLSGALNVNGMLWKTSPAVTELESVALAWLRNELGLGGDLFGIINDTASINSFLALAAAREATGLAVRSEGLTGRSVPQMRVYCSDQAHSSIEKGALALGFGVRGVRKIESDANFAMRADALRAAVEEDVASGVIPCAIVATAGTTSTASIDPIPEIGAIAAEVKSWFHVDAAYAGSATIAPELRFLWNGIERADSIVVNPHKWLFTPIDCSILYTRRPDILKETFSLVPEYLKTAEQEVVNYMDYGLQLGRRFRALKLWLVLEHYGVERLRAVIRSHVAYARELAGRLAARDDVEMLAPQSFSVVVFRKIARAADGSVDEAASETVTQEAVDRLNSSGRIFVSHTRLRGRLAIRIAIGNGGTEWRHLEPLLELL